MNNATTTHQSTLVVEKKARLLPEFIGNTLEFANSLTRSAVIVAHGLERTATGIDEITTIMLAQQKQRLLTQYEVKA